jgi:hypothetical protein
MHGCNGNGDGNDHNDDDDDDANSDDDDGDDDDNDGSGDGDGGGVGDSDCGATDNNQLKLQKQIRRARHDQDVLRRRLRGSRHDRRTMPGGVLSGGTNVLGGRRAPPSTRSTPVFSRDAELPPSGRITR